MPRANVYITDEDLPKWQAIENKSEFIRRALNEEGESDEEVIVEDDVDWGA